MLESLFEFDIWGAKQDLIPYVQQLILYNHSIEGWIIRPYMYDLFDGPSEAV